MRSRARKFRRGYGIRGYVGPNGHGKSLAMVYDTLPSLDMGRRVISNVRLLDYRNPRPCEGCDSPGHFVPCGDDVAVHSAAHPMYEPLLDYSQLLEAQSCDVLLDEVTGIASSRASAALPFQVVNLLMQLRRRDVTLSWTAPAWARADKVIREVSQCVIECRGMLSVSRETEGSMWRDRRLFRWSTYDAAEFESWTEGKREKSPRASHEWHWRPRGLAHLAYDTFDQVTALGWANEAGLCMTCGGNRPVPRCHCADSERGREASRVAAATSPAQRLTRAERRSIRSGEDVSVPTFIG